MVVPLSPPHRDEPIERLPPGVAERLGYYVYLYIDPRDKQPFYVGKGKGSRILSHIEDRRESAKQRVLSELRAAGLSPGIEILQHGIDDEETAFRIEAAAIDLLGLGSLTNAVRGFKSLEIGRMSLSELAGYYAAPPVTISHPALLVRINRLYRHNMSAHELYEATRGVWRLSARREGAQYACAVFEGVIREVYAIQSWHPANSTPYTTRQDELARRDLTGRWEFVGEVAPENVRAQYFGGSVRSYFKRGQQAPVVYVNCVRAR